MRCTTSLRREECLAATLRTILAHGPLNTHMPSVQLLIQSFVLGWTVVRPDEKRRQQQQQQQ